VCRVSVTPETMQVGDGMSSAADEQRNATDKLSCPSKRSPLSPRIKVTLHPDSGGLATQQAVLATSEQCAQHRTGDLPGRSPSPAPHRARMRSADDVLLKAPLLSASPRRHAQPRSRSRSHSPHGQLSPLGQCLLRKQLAARIMCSVESDDSDGSSDGEEVCPDYSSELDDEKVGASFAPANAAGMAGIDAYPI